MCNGLCNILEFLRKNRTGLWEWRANCGGFRQLFPVLCRVCENRAAISENGGETAGCPWPSLIQRQDELEGCAGGLGGVEPLPRHGLSVKLLPVHGDVPPVGQHVHQCHILLLGQALEQDADAEAVGQRGLFPDGLIAVHLVPGALGNGLPHQMAAVGVA